MSVSVSVTALAPEPWITACVILAPAIRLTIDFERNPGGLVFDFVGARAPGVPAWMYLWGLFKLTENSMAM